MRKMPEAVSGKGGHNTTYRVACTVIQGFDLDEHDAREVMDEYNQRLDEQWTEEELEHKVNDALKAEGRKPKGYLLGPTVKRRKTLPPVESKSRVIRL